MSELIAVMAITILAVISPGPDFAMVTRNSFTYGRRSGLLTAFGIACGVQLHVLYTVFGIAVIITHSPALFTGMKLLGAGYLIYLGWKAFTSTSTLQLKTASGPHPSGNTAFGMGFLGNALNPKTMLFVIATYSQVIQTDNTLSSNLAYGLFMSASHALWFGLVAIFFSTEKLRQQMLSKQHIIDKVIGTALFGLGISLILPAANH